MHLKSEIAQLSPSDSTPPTADWYLRRRGWDSNPRWIRDPQRFSRPPRSTTPAPLRTTRIIANPLLQGNRNLCCGYICHLTSCRLVIDLERLSCYHVIVSGNDNIRPFNVFHIAWFPISYTLGLNPLFMSTDLYSARVEGGEGKPISNARRLRRTCGKIGLR